MPWKKTNRGDNTHTKPSARLKFIGYSSDEMAR